MAYSDDDGEPVQASLLELPAATITVNPLLCNVSTALFYSALYPPPKDILTIPGVLEKYFVCVAPAHSIASKIIEVEAEPYQLNTLPECRVV